MALSVARLLTFVVVGRQATALKLSDFPAQRPKGVLLVEPDNLPRVENAVGIEDILQSPHRREKPAVLAGNPSIARQAHGMLGTDGPTQVENHGMHFLGNRGQFGDIIRSFQIQERSCMHLTGSGVNKKGGRGLMALQDFLEAVDKRWQFFQGNTYVLNEGYRLNRAPQPV